jgi:hypothetical protein
VPTAAVVTCAYTKSYEEVLMIIGYMPSGLTGFDPGEFPEAQDFTVELTSSEFGLNLTYRVRSLAITMEWG